MSGFLLLAVPVFWLLGGLIPFGRDEPTISGRLLEEPVVSLFAGVFWLTVLVMLAGVVLFVFGFGYDFVDQLG